MNERFKLNDEAIRDYLEREGRKQTYLSRKLSVSDSLVDRMMTGHVPKERTLKRLSEVTGIAISVLLIPLASQRTA